MLIETPWLLKWLLKPRPEGQCAGYDYGWNETNASRNDALTALCEPDAGPLKGRLPRKYVLLVHHSYLNKTSWQVQTYCKCWVFGCCYGVGFTGSFAHLNLPTYVPHHSCVLPLPMCAVVRMRLL